MEIHEFESKISHLNQDEVLTTSISAINKLLIEKGICKESELQNKFLELMSPDPNDWEPVPRCKDVLDIDTMGAQVLERCELDAGHPGDHENKSANHGEGYTWLNIEPGEYDLF